MDTESSSPVEPKQKRRKLEQITCQVCCKESSKYTCPRCRIHFCSLICCNEHKKIALCNGKRDKTAFVSLDQFSEQNMQSDYHFLEEAKSKKFSSLKRRLIDRIDSHEFQYHPSNVKFLQQKASQKGIFLSLMPEGMSKRKSNTTRYINKLDKFLWHLVLSFDQVRLEGDLSDKEKPVTLVQTGVSEDTLLFDIIRKYLDKNIEGNDAVIRNRLTKYVHWYEQALMNRPEWNDNNHNISEKELAPEEIPFDCFMQVLELPSNQIIYYKLDLTKTLNENLVDKVIIEYPTLHIVLPTHADKYPMATQQQLDEIKKKREEQSERRKKKREEYEQKQASFKAREHQSDKHSSNRGNQH
jgi:hypothetical protein